MVSSPCSSFSPFIARRQNFLQQATESKPRLLLCAVEAPALSITMLSSYADTTTELLGSRENREEEAKQSLTSLRRRLLLPTVLCTAPGLPAKASQSAKVVSTTRAMLPGGCCWGFARQRTAGEKERIGLS